MQSAAYHKTQDSECILLNHAGIWLEGSVTKTSQ